MVGDKPLEFRITDDLGETPGEVLEEFILDTDFFFNDIVEELFLSYEGAQLDYAYTPKELMYEVN